MVNPGEDDYPTLKMSEKFTDSTIELYTNLVYQLIMNN